MGNRVKKVVTLKQALKDYNWCEISDNKDDPEVPTTEPDKLIEHNNEMIKCKAGKIQKN